MSSAFKSFALAGAFAIAGCSQSGFGSAPGALGAAGGSMLPNTLQTGPGLGRAHRHSGSTGPQIYVFQGYPDAGAPQVGVVNVGNTLYGTTQNGGADNIGAVYSVTTGGIEKVVHSFTGGADGQNPVAPLTAVDGTIYGTAFQGGAAHGTIFKITPSGKYSIVYNFGVTSGDCTEPDTAMIYVPSQKALYGTGYGGGANGEGCIFKLSMTSKKVQESIVYSFTGAPTSSTGASAPVFLKNALYVTTPEGGANGYGAVLEVTLSGQESVLYSFKNDPDGAHPVAALLALGGALYGTTDDGGKGACVGYAGCGTIFKVTLAGKETVLYRFMDSTTKVDGGGPTSPLIAVAGTLYGTSQCTGPDCSSVVFSESPSGGKDSIVYVFGDVNPIPNGYPEEASYGLLSLNGMFYGTSFGSAHVGDGTVWAVPQ